MFVGTFNSIYWTLAQPLCLCEAISVASVATLTSCALYKVQLLHRDALGEISWLVDVAASSYGDVVGEELEGDYFEDGE